MNIKTGNGMYYIDSEFRVVHFNRAVKEMYPEIEKGHYCYETLACRSNICPHCPLIGIEKQNTFYNSVRHEWINAQAAETDLPGYENCYCIVFSRKSGDDDFSNESITLSGDTIRKDDRTGMIGGYCEEGFPLFFANDKMIHMLGYDDYDDFYRGTKGLVSNTIHPDDMAQVIADIGGEYYEGLEYNTVYRMPCKDGSWFWTCYEKY